MGLDTPGVIVEPVKFGGLIMLFLALKYLGSEFVLECLCLGGSRRWYSVECRRVKLLGAGGDQGKNVACVMGCAEVRGLPARQI